MQGRGSPAPRRRRRRPRGPRGWVAFLLPWALLASGLALSVLASFPRVDPAGSSRFQGTVGANGTVDHAFNETGYSYVVFELEVRPSCSLRVYALDPDRAADYRASGSLPPVAESLNCDRLRSTAVGEVVLVVASNPFAGSADYSVRADRFRIAQPDALWAIPGFGLALAGAAALAIGRLRAGMEGILADLGTSRRPRRPSGVPGSPSAPEGEAQGSHDEEGEERPDPQE